MQVLQILFDVVAPVFLVALVGYLWARSGNKLDSAFVALLVNTIATPCLILDTLLRSGVTASALSQMAGVAAVTMVVTFTTAWLLVKAMGLPVKTYLPSLTWSNAGNMGLPLSLFAFGEQGLSLAIAFFTVSSLSNYTIGLGVAAGGVSFREILRMPIVYAIALALFLIVTGYKLPLFAGRAVQLLGGIAVPLMLLSLGYALATLKFDSLRLNLVLSLARLIGGFAIGWGVAMLFGLDGVARGVVVLQSAMPAAVLNYLFAARYDNDPQEIAGLVVLSTALAMILLPIFLWTVV
jgi:predicted permease